MRPSFYIPERPADESPTVSLVGTISTGRLSRPPALPAHLAALRDRLRPARSRGGCLPFDDPRMDACRPGGGLPLGQLHEIGASGLEAETAALPTAFIAALLCASPGSRSSGSPPRPTCIRPGCCPATSIPTGWSWCIRPRISTRSPPWRSRCARAWPPPWWAGGTVRPHRLASAACLPRSRFDRLRAAPRRMGWDADREASVAVTRWHLTAVA